MMRLKRIALPLLVALGLIAVALGQSADKPESTSADKPDKPGEQAVGKRVPLNKGGTVLLDPQAKRVLVKSKVVLREGLLEMLLCKRQTKEHESVLAVDAQIYVIHAGLVALGAEPGSPVRFQPEFQAPQGQRIDIFLQWTDEKGKLHRVPAQQWIRYAINRFYAEPLDKLPAGLTIPKESDLRYDEKHRELSWYGPMTEQQRDELLALSDDPKYRKAIESFHKQSQPRQMNAHWVFAGSGFFVDEESGERHYQAEGGDVICVANFPSAMLDLAKESTATGEDNLLFEAWTERIPPIDTEVTMELVPVFEKK